MLRGLYSSAAGLKVLQRQQDVLANNVANANTPGFKRDQTVLRSFPEQIILTRETGKGAGAKVVGPISLGAQIHEVNTVFENGIMAETGRPTDFALGGSGLEFFAIATSEGERYTRSGSFSLDQEGYLVTPAGDYLLGYAGKIRLQGEDFSVDPAGRVFQGQEFIDQLRIVRIKEPAQLIKKGHHLYQAAKEGAVEDVKEPYLRQGVLELSNVSLTSEVIKMIAGMRAYEINARLLKVQDELLGKAVNEIGAIK
ncbi:MAG: flagellar hook-basal body protein [Bacillota bacterium]